jgi:hypothetical protein
MSTNLTHLAPARSRPNLHVLAMTFSRLTLLGGAAMGPDGDSAAVVDEHCRVRGVEGLRVVDLRVVPVPLRATTAPKATMIGARRGVGRRRSLTLMLMRLPNGRVTPRRRRRAPEGRG